MMSPADYQPRIDFVRWHLDQNAAQTDFCAHVLFTDEGTFTHESIFNTHSTHLGIYKPACHHSFQWRFSVNVWIRIPPMTIWLAHTSYHTFFPRGVAGAAVSSSHQVENVVPVRFACTLHLGCAEHFTCNDARNWSRWSDRLATNIVGSFVFGHFLVWPYAKPNLRVPHWNHYGSSRQDRRFCRQHSKQHLWVVISWHFNFPIPG